MEPQERHLLIVTENVRTSRTSNFAKAAKRFFNVRFLPEYGRLWSMQKRTPPPLSWIVISVRHLLGIFHMRHIRGARFCYFQDLDVPEAVLSRALGFRTILDVIEPFSLAARDYPLGIYGARPWFVWLTKELICYRLSNVIIVVCPEYAPWVEAKSGKEPIVVENFPDVNVFRPAQKHFDQFSVVYFGGSSPSRTLQAVDLALHDLKRELRLRFHLIGPPDLTEGLMSVDDYHGYLSDEEAASIIGMCHVGIAPYLQNEHTRYTLPNKISSMQPAAYFRSAPRQSRSADSRRFADSYAQTMQKDGIRPCSRRMMSGGGIIQALRIFGSLWLPESGLAQTYGNHVCKESSGTRKLPASNHLHR